MAGGSRKKILFLSHEASLTGAPMMLLHLIRWLKANRPIDPVIGLLAGGPLAESFAELGPVFEWRNTEPTEWESLLDGVQLVYSNTACHGALSDWFSDAGIPVISHIHEMEGELRLRGDNSLQQMVAATDHFIACSSPVSRCLQEMLQISEMNVSVIHEAIDMDAVRANAQAATADSGASLFPDGFFNADDGWAFAAMGTVTWRKGTDLFLSMAAEICRRDPTARGLWIGKVPTSESERLDFELNRLGLADRLWFTGEQSNPHALLAHARIFCLTSREDPFPLVMIEACALGKTVIGFENSGGVEDFVPFTGGRLVPYLNTSALADAVLEEAGKGDPSEDVVRNRIDWVENHLHIEAIAPQIDEVLDRFLRSNRPPLSASLIRDKGANLKNRLAPECAGKAYLGWDGKYGESPNWSGTISGGPLRLEIQVPRDGLKAEAERLRLRVHSGTGSACLQVHGWELRNSAGEALATSGKEKAPRFRGSDVAIQLPAESDEPDEPITFALFDDDARVFLDIREKDCPELKTATQLVADLEVSHDLGERLQTVFENSDAGGGKKRASAWPFS